MKMGVICRMTKEQNDYNRRRYAQNPDARQKILYTQRRNRARIYKQRNERRYDKKKVIDEIRSKTYCYDCGKQPIEWHNEDHTIYPERRISHMLSKNRPLTIILDEISQCIPLCRKCHIHRDGRLHNLKQFSMLVNVEESPTQTP